MFAGRLVCVVLSCVCLSCWLLGLWLFGSLGLCMFELIVPFGLFELCLFDSF